MKKSHFYRTFFFRIFTSYVGLIASVFFLVYFFAQGAISHFYLAKLKTHLTQVGQTLEPQVTQLHQTKDLDGLDRLVKQLGHKISIRLTVIEPSGKVIADSEKNPWEMENHGDRPEIREALKGKVQDASSTRFSTTMNEKMLYLALPIEINGEPQMVIRLSLFVSDIDILIRNLKWKFVAVLVVLFLLVLLFAWYFSSGITRPVRDIVAATREFASGNFNVKIFTQRKDELSEVAESFNKMVIDQSILFTEVNDSRAELHAIISSMKEGLLVVNSSGKVILCNDSFRAISPLDEPTDNFYWEALRIPHFEELVKKAFLSEDSFYQDVDIDENSFLVGFNRMPQCTKLVITFRDISDFKQLEQMKKDFIVNLTHELKTPLTAIKGFMETLEDEEEIQNNRYVEIIKRHTERMNQIVSDMLILSELEDRKKDVVFEPFNISSMVTDILKIFQERVEAKGIKLAVDIQANLPPVKGEKFKLEQMFINLVDNAVKYTDKGEIRISINKEETRDGKDGKDISANKANKILNIQVSNTGLPIPSKSLSRLFERFYVVDKSRSRKLGGTGLGLSIVKHVVLLHNGDISVQSTRQKGTIFKIRLPLA